MLPGDVSDRCRMPTLEKFRRRIRRMKRSDKVLTVFVAVMAIGFVIGVT